MARNLNKYGYKVCYKEENSHKEKVHLVTNSLWLALHEKQWYETHPQFDRKTKLKIINPTWLIKEVKTYLEYSKLWRGCPFRDYLSDFIKRSKDEKLKFGNLDKGARSCQILLGRKCK